MDVRYRAPGLLRERRKGKRTRRPRGDTEKKVGDETNATKRNETERARHEAGAPAAEAKAGAKKGRKAYDPKKES